MGRSRGVAVGLSWPRWVPILGVLLGLWGCGAPSDPEAEIRAVIEGAVEAAEARESAALRRVIADDYSDPDGNGKREMDGLVRLILLRQRSIHLFTRVKEVEVGEGWAEARVVVAAASQPLTAAESNVEALLSLRAELLDFRLEFARRGGDWRVVEASWERAAPGDFL
ncbi:MAG: hypothetical protein ACFCBW_13855 [Candidatus Competibacterales bacterium]